MADDVTRGEGIRERGPRETRDADARRDGVKGGGLTPGSGLPPGTRATDTAGAAGAGATGTRAAGLPGHDTTAGGTGGRAEGRTDGRTEGRTDGRTPDAGEGAAPVTREHHTPGATGGTRSTGTSLLPHDESDKLTLRLQHAVGEFVDGPRSAVEEADQVLEEAAARFTDAVTQRRRTLRASWQTTADDRAGTTDTEQLRLALRDYRELTERLLRL